MAIVDLASHPFSYVTVTELAEYWRLSRAHIREHLSAGHLEAIRFGGVIRIRTEAARAFEERAAVPRGGTTGTQRTALLTVASNADREERSAG